MYIVDNYIYRPTQIREVLTLAVNERQLVSGKKGVLYYNIPAAYDIEVSSFYRHVDDTYSYQQVSKLGVKNVEKVANMYVWHMGINGRVMIGRTWDEFSEVCKAITDHLGLSESKRLIIWVHNLSYEFQFIRKRFTWKKVFAVDERKPVYAVTSSGIEFRCSYILSGKSLEQIGNELIKYKRKKLVGGLNYELIRHSDTPLTDTELRYCFEDIAVLMSYIQEQIEGESISRLPLTKTGYVRRYCRQKCTITTYPSGYKGNNWDYYNLMRELTITDNEFTMLRRAFQGGFTHANAERVRETITDVASYDFTSSYPAVMISEQYPMSRGVQVQPKDSRDFEKLLKQYCCVFDVEFTDLVASRCNDNPISRSKCLICDNFAENNGRIVAAKRIVTTITDVDYHIYKQFYTWSGMRVGTMYCYKRKYLPTNFVSSVLDLYAKKTLLKGVEGMEREYMQAKEMLNSTYGMCVTDPIRDEYQYDAEWSVHKLDAGEQAESLYKYNTSRNRFLFYAWGVFVTAYARRNLFTAIHELGSDYLYSDTDSVKLVNHSRHQHYFTAYNAAITAKLEQACRYHHIDTAAVKPVNKNGNPKPLGVWDYEGVYDRFKTLGAKRYMYQQDGCLHITIAGVPKRAGAKYLQDRYGLDGAFAAFDDYLSIPATSDGKKTHTYIDYAQSGNVTDYMGNPGTYNELSSVNLEPCGYSLSMSVNYLNYLMGIKFKSESYE